MNNPETEFARELEVFENEIDEAMRCFYVWLTVHRLARENVKIFDFLNEYASFWNPALRALQANSIIALGCVFDRDQRSHSIDRLLQIAEQNSMMFSKAAIRRRKSTTLGADKWIDDFMQGVHVPAARDFRRLRRYVDARHKTYEKSYRNLRHKVFAHRDRNHVNASFRNATTRELAGC